MAEKWARALHDIYLRKMITLKIEVASIAENFRIISRNILADERGDVPGWVLVVLMTTGLVTAIWAIAEPRLSQLLRNSLDSMNTVR